MKRVILAATMQDVDVLNLVGRREYDQMYKRSCHLIDREIYNEYGREDIRWTNGGATAKDNGDGTYDITHQIYAEFETARGNTKYCYGETSCTFDSKNPGKLMPKLDFFSDDVQYE